MHNLLKSVIVFCCLTLYCFAASVEFKERVYNGDEVVENEFPYMAALMLRDNFHCSAGLISSKFVISAAHCFVYQTNTCLYKGNIEQYQIRVGSYNYRNADEFEIKNVVLPKESSGYTFLEYQDIAVIQLIKEIPSNIHVNYLSLPHPSHQLTIGMKMNISGWGSLTLDRDHSKYKPTLKKLSVVLDECPASYNIETAGNMICTRNVSSSPSYGDSGAPLVNNGIIFGVVKGPLYNKRTEIKFAKVSHFIKFIMEATKEEGDGFKRIPDYLPGYLNPSMIVPDYVDPKTCDTQFINIISPNTIIWIPKSWKMIRKLPYLL